MTDSRIYTYQHMDNVRKLLMQCVIDLQSRTLDHDASKLESPEREGYDYLVDRLYDVEHGSDEYREILRSQKPIIKHHVVANRRHHPDGNEHGILDMNLLDLIEMLCDWKAASLRGKGNSLRDHMKLNQARFGYSDDTHIILMNTLNFLEESE